MIRNDRRVSHVSVQNGGAQYPKYLISPAFLYTESECYLPERAVSTEDHLTLFALAALLLWPIASLCIFANSKKLSRGLIWSVLVAQLLLPVGAAIKFQMIPRIDKVFVANFCALLGCLIFSRRKPTAPPSSRFGLVEALFLLSIVSPIITSTLNPDNIVIGARFLPGVGIYDAISAAEA
jgi:hypothetical protein